ncbi:ImmA/IrrE family metallo-endopeptidase [Companilactobacillus sp.]|jgi:Zn-dependent peptidase ImmA (M78 family)|uniref:ImmA/IrrE family metallo-endopeptidase n=2 Tax=Companilactobacillus sp. TaxID=2767905 RepID=UPI0025B9B800|nr:ImmA/IrrE family metallo-endopeptidase [Companilactobacillus sp.]MCH4009948.1 ImmA/IrrE family metallo-endopeptidase [Companilactobacillus sp.]MCH4052376.1 ImmA/IrrE family metallo-endopeptidase [Companilactobacillus sp.]MCH4077890.1 ImmA/IrrE family metallo-endopeptidase [Companilactobacillus sp.]MCH4126466.1 ImmA/IrrE family metallo-endopeptidase [Companilactobacillus sp.]MCI1312393.1 ImmA/IrrE family metallo-endopeptidase [Companilactobacillus sp.]
MMTTLLRIPVDGKVIQWAIDNGEKNDEDLLKKYSINKWKNAKNKSDYPTFNQLQGFSRDTKIPFRYLIKSSIPEENNDFVKYRTVNNSDVLPSRKLVDTIHQMESRQAWMKQYLLEQKTNHKFDLLNQLSVNIDPISASSNVIDILNLSSVYQSFMTDDDFFSLLKNRISDYGVLVMQNGIVGSNTQRPLNVDEFRAFVLIDDIVPLIFINSKDSKTAKIFSLIHEFIHILLGNNEILNVSPDVDVKDERWINTVTINVLMPKERVLKIVNWNDSPEDNVRKLSRKFHTSILATSIRTVELNIFSQKIVDWAQVEQKNALANKKSSSGGNFYNNAVSRVDLNFANAVISDEATGNMPLSTAADMLGVSLKTYQKTVNKILGLE